MLKALKQEIWWLAIILADYCQHGAAGPNADGLIVAAALLDTVVRATWLSLPRSRRDRHDHKAPYRLVRGDVRIVALWRTWAGQDSTLSNKPA